MFCAINAPSNSAGVRDRNNRLLHNTFVDKSQGGVPKRNLVTEYGETGT